MKSNTATSSHASIAAAEKNKRGFKQKKNHGNEALKY